MSRPITRQVLLVLSAALACAACRPPELRVTVETTQANSPLIEISSAQRALPPELNAGATIAALPCPAGFCELAPGQSLVTFSCNNGVCDPNPIELWVPATVIDLEAFNSELHTLVRSITSIEVHYIRHAVLSNSLTLGLPGIDLYWGSQGVVDRTSPGVFLLGHLPPTSPGQTTAPQPIALQPLGLQALTDHLLSVSRRFQVLASVPIDLAPNQPLPMGSMSMGLSFSMTFVGSVL
ncbi:MAG: hypothetical protein MJD61_02270 [Proteobacteria bacterium]|nr:hypothetical protein [Pseudomonadota bacterium]